MSNPRSFRPNWPLRHPDIQNIASSIGPRHWFLRGKIRPFQRAAQKLVLDCGADVRLNGELNLATEARGLVFLLHGWEGSSQSGYLLSLALHLHSEGYSVFRLNFRDHGDSHHLNHLPFNSTRLDEVINALAEVAAQYPHDNQFLAGFSLGGNFALRIALLPHDQQRLALDQVVAVCPVINPGVTIERLTRTRAFYQKYFVNKWRKSLLKKLDTSPDLNYRQPLLEMDNLIDMHDFFVPRFTPYPDRHRYFADYTIHKENLLKLTTNTLIINSQDDPITEANDIPSDVDHPCLQVELPRYGSHCAFLKNLKMESWVDERICALFNVHVDKKLASNVGNIQESATC